MAPSVPQGHTKHFYVMESVFHAAPGGKVHEVYDLKGSWVDRCVPPLFFHRPAADNRTPRASCRHADLPDASSGTYKDLDLRKPFQLKTSDAEALFADLKRDSELLESNNLMDYSLVSGCTRADRRSLPSAPALPDCSHPRSPQLVGVHNQPVTVDNLGLDLGATDVVAQSVDVPRFYLGIIDVLQARLCALWG